MHTDQPFPVALVAEGVELLDGDDGAMDEALVDDAEAALADDLFGAEVGGGGPELVVGELLEVGPVRRHGPELLHVLGARPASPPPSPTPSSSASAAATATAAPTWAQSHRLHSHTHMAIIKQTTRGTYKSGARSFLKKTDGVSLSGSKLFH